MSRFRDFGVAVAALMLLSACDQGEPDDFFLCREAAKAMLRSPSTFKEISIVRTDKMPGGGSWVVSSFDSSNAYGVQVRTTAMCQYPAGTDASTARPKMMAIMIDGRRFSDPDLTFISATAKADTALMRR